MKLENKKLLTDKLIELELIKSEDEIKDDCLVEFEKITKGNTLNESTVEQLAKYLFGIHQKDRYETVLYYKLY